MIMENNLILEKLEAISGELQDIKIKMNNIEKKTQRMNGHISFVEDTYTKIQKPFNYIIDKTTKFIEHQPCPRPSDI